MSQPVASPLSLGVATSIAGVPAAAWDALVPADNPFLSHAFLAGLEASGSVGPAETGWLPRPLLAHRQGQLVGAVPLYLKLDSFGEYVFDQAWAHGAARAGIDYYPKLVAAVPFSPVPGPRLLAGEAPAPGLRRQLVAGVGHLLAQSDLSGAHVLFCPDDERPLWAEAGYLPRQDVQFHWHRQPGWHHYEDFLAALRAPARKQIRRERAQARAHGLSLGMWTGPEMRPEHWAAVAALYQSTVAKKGGIPYLTTDFFAQLRQHLADRVVVAFAERAGDPVAGALFLRGQRTLYGRSWGSFEPLDAMHFELCYHLAVEWGLRHGIWRIEAGAQGPHKHKRGFLPAVTTSMHRLTHPGLEAAVAASLRREAQALAAGLPELMRHTPFARPAADG